MTIPKITFSSFYALFILRTRISSPTLGIEVRRGLQTANFAPRLDQLEFMPGEWLMAVIVIATFAVAIGFVLIGGPQSGHRIVNLDPTGRSVSIKARTDEQSTPTISSKRRSDSNPVGITVVVFAKTEMSHEVAMEYSLSCIVSRTAQYRATM